MSEQKIYPVRVKRTQLQPSAPSLPLKDRKKLLARKLPGKGKR